MLINYKPDDCCFLGLRLLQKIRMTFSAVDLFFSDKQNTSSLVSGSGIHEITASKYWNELIFNLGLTSLL